MTSLQTSVCEGRTLGRWLLLSWHGGLATNQMFPTRKAARAAKTFDDQQIVRVDVLFARHRIQRGIKRDRGLTTLAEE